MEAMDEQALEAIIMAKGPQQHEARYILGKNMIEGLGKIAKNENKGFNWLKESVKAGNIQALEYKQYYDIRFGKSPSIEEIQANLEKVIDENKSTKACNTIAELHHSQGSAAQKDQSPEIVEKINMHKA